MPAIGLESSTQVKNSNMLSDFAEKSVKLFVLSEGFQKCIVSCISDAKVLGYTILLPYIGHRSLQICTGVQYLKLLWFWRNISQIIRIKGESPKNNSFVYLRCWFVDLWPLRFFIHKLYGWIGLQVIGHHQSIWRIWN